MQSKQEAGFQASTLSDLTSDSAIVKLSIKKILVTETLKTKCPRILNTNPLFQFHKERGVQYKDQKQKETKGHVITLLTYRCLIHSISCSTATLIYNNMWILYELQTIENQKNNLKF